jgi:hypothetical protein
MTWYAGVKTGNEVNAGDEPFETDDELREHILQSRASFDDEPYVVQLQEGHKSVYRARFKSNKTWDLDPLLKYSTPPSAE